MDAGIWAVILGGAAFLFGLYLLIFRKGRRKHGAVITVAAPILTLFAVALFVTFEAQQQGWESSVERAEAEKAGITSPDIWHAQLAETERLRAEAAAKAQAATEAEFRRLGDHCRWPFDGSVSDLVTKVKAQLRDPDSFEHIATEIREAQDGKHPARMEYRARNGFGGMNVASAAATINAETCIATVLIVE